jgi:hypothetical protein
MLYSKIDEMVKIFVGDGTKQLLHKEFACYHSPVLRVAFQGRLPQPSIKLLLKAALKTGE